MNGILWALQILLALVFLVTGMMKVVRPKEQLVTQMDWVVESPQPVVWLVGLLEILGAAFTNYQHKEYSKIGLNLFLFVLALFVAVGRIWIAPLY